MKKALANTRVSVNRNTARNGICMLKPIRFSKQASLLPNNFNAIDLVLEYNVFLLLCVGYSTLAITL